MEAIWKPVGSEEGFEVVCRRLFLPLDDESARDNVCRAFSALYRDGGGRPLTMLLTERQVSDYREADAVLDDLPNADTLIADKGYDSDRPLPVTFALSTADGAAGDYRAIDPTGGFD